MPRFTLKIRAPYVPPLVRMLDLQPGSVISGPLVSCLMVSRGATWPALKAIECYRQQSYANRELVIVSANCDRKLAKLVAEIGDPSIRYYQVEDRTLGELRNCSVARAKGEFLCQWDDDDIYHSDRLALQMAAIASTGANGCYLSRLLLWWPERELLRVSSERSWEGSMVAHRSVVPIFPAMAREEDLYVVDRIGKLHEVVQIDYPFGYCYVVHDCNVNDAAHFERVFFRNTALDKCPTYHDALSLVGSILPLDRM